MITLLAYRVGIQHRAMLISISPLQTCCSMFCFFFADYCYHCWYFCMPWIWMHLRFDIHATARCHFLLSLSFTFFSMALSLFRSLSSSAFQLICVRFECAWLSQFTVILRSISKPPTTTDEQQNTVYAAIVAGGAITIGAHYRFTNHPILLHKFAFLYPFPSASQHTSPLLLLVLFTFCIFAIQKQTQITWNLLEIVYREQLS